MYNFSSKNGNSSHYLKTDGFSCQKIYKDVFLLSVGNGCLPEYEDFVRFVKDIKQDILNTVSQIEGFDKMSMVERQYMFIKERLFRIVREYGWTYKGGKLDGNE